MHSLGDVDMTFVRIFILFMSVSVFLSMTFLYSLDVLEIIVGYSGTLTAQFK